MVDLKRMTELERYEAFLKLYRSTDPADAEQLEALYGSADPIIPLILLQYLEELPEKAAALAIIGLIEEDNEVVSRAAMSAYAASHYPGKARLLKQLILSPSERACRFAVRALSRAGFMEILPLLLRELPDRNGAVRYEMLDGLRFLPDRRSLPVLLPLADSDDAETRLRAVRALAEIHGRWGAVPLKAFLRLSRDESEAVRLLALEALERFPTRSVAPLILESALDRSQPEEARARAIRSLSRFPSAALTRPLAALAAGSEPPAVKLAAEATLRAFPAAALRSGLLPLLDEDSVSRRQAALALAELLGSDEAVRERLLALWGRLDAGSKLDFVDVLRVLGAADALAEAVRGGSVLGYAAAEALARCHGPAVAPAVVRLLREPGTAVPARQALLSRWTKREPEPSVSAELRTLLIAFLKDPTLNIRYLALTALTWYPLGGTLHAVLDLLTTEADPTTARAAVRHVVRTLGRDPLPLVEAVRAHPERAKLLGHVVRALTARAWDPACGPALLDALAEPPLSLLDERPETYFAVCSHLLELGAVSFRAVWSHIPDEARRRRFIELFTSFVANPRRRYPRLPYAFLVTELEDEPRLLHELLSADGRDEALEWLGASLARRPDPAGAKRLRSLLLEEPR